MSVIFYRFEVGLSTFVKRLGSAVAGQNNTYIPHKGVLSPAEKVLYVTSSNGAGPYDGTLGESSNVVANGTFV